MILEGGQSPIHQDFNYENTSVLLTEKYNELPTVRDLEFVFSVKLVIFGEIAHLVYLRGKSDDSFYDRLISAENCNRRSANKTKLVVIEEEDRFYMCVLHESQRAQLLWHDWGQVELATIRGDFHKLYILL